MKGLLTLETGDGFSGQLYAYLEPVKGDLVVYNGMSGFQEVLTNPAYAGKIVLFTFPLVGRCGIDVTRIKNEGTSVRALIMNEVVDRPYHYASTQSLEEFLHMYHIPYLKGVDTRSIVKQLAKTGQTTCSLTKHAESISKISTSEYAERKKTVTIAGGSMHLVIIDYGIDEGTLSFLKEEGFTITLVSPAQSFAKIRKLNPDMIVLSDGPFRPDTYSCHQEDLKALVESYPTIATGFGLQMIAQLYGATVKKMHTGHFGHHYPILDQTTKKVYITTQHHPYDLDGEWIRKSGFTLRFKNVNDQSIEGIDHDKLPMLGLQFPLQASVKPILDAFIKQWVR